MLEKLRIPRKAPPRGRVGRAVAGDEAPDRGEGAVVTGLRIAAVAAMALAFTQILGCASITAYEASHPYYRFPARGGGGGYE